MKHISSVHVPFLAGYSYNIALPGHLELLLNHWCPLGIPIVVVCLACSCTWKALLPAAMLYQTLHLDGLLLQAP